MILARAWLIGLCLAAAVSGSGCCPRGDTALDEQKDPHHLTGKNRVSSLDYSGATESFEKALEANPRSASAHFELGVLYEQRSTNYARAIYHFERFLDLRPESDFADPVKSRILACKQEMARTVSLGPVTRDMQRDLERLTEENVRLKAQLQQLQTQLAQRPVIQVAVAPTNPLPSNGGSGTTTPVVSNSPTRTATPATAGSAIGSVAMTTQATVARTAARTHTVKQGDTPFGIAKQYGVSTSALLSANPKMDPKRLKIGQQLNIPPASRP